MTIRVGVDAVIEEALLRDFPNEVQLVRIAEKLQGEVEVDFWVPALPPKIVHGQWAYLKGVRVVQVPWAGVDTLRHIFPPEG
jgi:hypothetical protein